MTEKIVKKGDICDFFSEIFKNPLAIYGKRCNLIKSSKTMVFTECGLRAVSGAETMENRKIWNFFQNWLAIHWNACILNDIVFRDVLVEERDERTRHGAAPLGVGCFSPRAFWKKSSLTRAFDCGGSRKRRRWYYAGYGMIWRSVMVPCALFLAKAGTMERTGVFTLLKNVLWNKCWIVRWAQV